MFTTIWKLILASTFVFLVPFGAQAAGLGGTYSQGARMGQLVKFSVKGFWTKSGEGQLMLGSEGAPYSIFSTDSEGKVIEKILNPWAFSAEEPMWDAVSANVGEYVVMEYDQSQIGNSFAQDTDYTVTSVAPVTRTNPGLGGCQTVKPSTSWHDGGKRVGRIVKASYKGAVFKTYEIMLQLGNSGNQFLEMSIVDEGIFNCAMRALKSGKRVTIDYVEYVVQLKRDTNYDIYGISLPESLD